MRNTSALIIAAAFTASLAAGACSSKPSEADCKKLADNYVKQMSAGQEGPAAEITREVAEGMHLGLIKDCLDRGKQSEVDCAIKATTMEEMQKCGDANTR